VCCLRRMKARKHLSQQDNIEATVFCTIPCDSEVPSNVSDWLKGNTRPAQQSRSARVQVPNSGDAPWLSPILGGSVILGAREVASAVHVGVTGINGWKRFLEGVGSSRPKNWRLANLSHSAPSVHIRSTSLCWD
jgi:hypothetical protein